MWTRSFLGRQFRGGLGRLGRRGTAPWWTTAPSLMARRLGVLEPVDDVAHDRAGVASVRVDPQRGDPPVQRNTLCHQRFEFLAAVAAGQEWPHRGTAGAAYA